MQLTAQSIADYLKTLLYGENLIVTKPCSLKNIVSGGLLFAKNYSADIEHRLNSQNDILVLACTEYYEKLNCSYIICKNPRLDFARIVQAFFVTNTTSHIASTAKVGGDISIGKNVSIGEFSIIGNNVTIGDNTVIRNHVVIAENTRIGSACLIKSHAVIGEEGFGFENDENSVPVRLPHIGGVNIGNNVEIGAFTAIAKGTLDYTIIGDNVKIDDCCHIAHNVVIEENSLIIACSQIGGSSHIQKDCWLGQNCTIKNGITVGSNTLIGSGTVLIQSADSGMVIVGNPGRIIKKR